MKYTLSKTKFKDTEISKAEVEGELLSITLYTYLFEFRSSPNTTEILEDDLFYTLIEGNKVRRFKKADVYRVDYEFDSPRQINDFIK